jgi:hypothetical protein
VGWPSHRDVGQPLNRQHDKGGNQARQRSNPEALPPSPPAEKATARRDQAGDSANAITVPKAKAC